MAGDAAGIGARLRAGREKLNLTVLQAAERMHVDPRLLESLEAEDFAALGAPVYTRGHLRNYAELVGESAPQLSELLSRVELEGQPDLTRIAKAPPSVESSKLILPALFVLAVFAVAGAVWWVLSLAPQQPIPTNELSAPPNADRASPSGSGGASPAIRPGAVPPHAAVGPTHLASAGGPITVPSGTRGAVSVTQIPDRGSSATAPPSTALPPQPDSAPAPHPSREQQVTLHYSADCWTEVYDSSGQRLYYDVGAAGSTRTLKGTAPLRVVLANAAGVAVEVDGRGTSIARMAQPDGSAEFLVNRSGRVARTRAPSSGD
ncbi:MAG TPA: RodZ domain-containing protein [Steroidobacteraceae bacterium]|nr:RodZ domain-containing protein [Steroidobacteraceae bacterium]